MASADRLVAMANQIGAFFAAQGTLGGVTAGGGAAEAIATHLRRFWDPRMRRAILAHLDAGGAGLDPLVREAVQRLRPATGPPCAIP